MRTQTTSIPDLLERERELETLGEAVARTREGAGGALLIEAPAGVGKSRLMGSARMLARDAGLQVLEARGAVLEREFAFGVARQLLEQPVTRRDRGAARRSLRRRCRALEATART